MKVFVLIHDRYYGEALLMDWLIVGVFLSEERAVDEAKRLQTHGCDGKFHIKECEAS